jgi:hypothetical protein
MVSRKKSRKKTSAKKKSAKKSARKRPLRKSRKTVALLEADIPKPPDPV